jgi:hypothetical protein
VRECAILVAVIGPNWLGERAGQPNRILDPADWVGKEITGALNKGTIIIPVLINGALPLTAADLAPEHAELATRSCRCAVQLRSLASPMCRVASVHA